MTTENIKKHNLDFLLFYIFSASHEVLGVVVAFLVRRSRSSVTWNYHRLVLYLDRAANYVTQSAHALYGMSFNAAAGCNARCFDAVECSRMFLTIPSNNKLFFASYSYLNIFFWIENLIFLVTITARETHTHKIPNCIFRVFELGYVPMILARNPWAYNM